MKLFLKRTLPAGLWALLRASGQWKARREQAVLRRAEPKSIYEALYEVHSQRFSDEDVVGGLFDLIGRVELGILLMEGVKPSDTVLDFGCGTGRLAAHLIPILKDGHYIGIDVAQPILDRAQERLAKRVPRASCRVTWIKQTTPVFPLPDRSVDLMCAFSVFTHVEHEDTYRYLADARRVIRPDGRFVFFLMSPHESGRGP